MSGYSGDLMLTGSEPTPLDITIPEDLFFEMQGVEGDLELQNVEYVYTHQAATGDADVTSPEKRIDSRRLEDGYVQQNGVNGDLVVSRAEDVFIPAHAVSGDITARGAENIYHDDTSLPTPDEFDLQKTGWIQSGRVSNPSTGVYVTGAKHSITVENVQNAIDVYVIGWDHDINISGKGGTVNVHFLGRDNRVEVGPYLEVEWTETGHENTVSEAPFPVKDLVDTTKKEAFPSLGKTRARWQEPAPDDDWCNNCGESADAIVNRRWLDAFFLFGKPVKTFDGNVDKSSPPQECENCSDNVIDPELSELERKNLLG